MLEVLWYVPSHLRHLTRYLSLLCSTWFRPHRIRGTWFHRTYRIDGSSIFMPQGRRGLEWNQIQRHQLILVQVCFRYQSVDKQVRWWRWRQRHYHAGRMVKMKAVPIDHDTMVRMPRHGWWIRSSDWNCPRIKRTVAVTFLGRIRPHWSWGKPPLKPSYNPHERPASDMSQNPKRWRYSIHYNLCSLYMFVEICTTLCFKYSASLCCCTDIPSSWPQSSIWFVARDLSRWLAESQQRLSRYMVIQTGWYALGKQCEIQVHAVVKSEIAGESDPGTSTGGLPNWPRQHDNYKISSVCIFCAR